MDPKVAPNALVATYEWDHYACVDLLTVRDFEQVTTARVPTPGGAVDHFRLGARGLGLIRVRHRRRCGPCSSLVHPAHPGAPTVE